MTFAELMLLTAAAAGIYMLLRPLQRRLESYLTRKLSGRPRGTLPPIDVTDFTSYSAHKKDRDRP
jgi:hypothetical protein